MNNIVTTIKKELRAIIRDRKSLTMMILTPLMIPFFMILFSYVYDDMENEVTHKDFEVGVNYDLNSVERKIVKEYNLKTIKYESVKELEAAYEKKSIYAYIVKNDNKYTIYSNSNDTESAQINIVSQSYLNNYNKYLSHKYLQTYNVDFEKVDHSIIINNQELKGSNEFVNTILLLGIIFSMMAIALTAIYGVSDTIAGEKERGTLETLLTFPIKSSELVVGKFLAITISCIITAIISELLVLVSIYISSNMFEMYNNIDVNINIVSVMITFILMFSYSIFISGLCISIASFARTYKEAQSFLTPVSFITMIPMIFNLLGIKMSFPVSFIPVVSHTLLINDMITLGMFNGIYLDILVILISSIIYSGLLIFFILKIYKNEKVLFSL